MYVCVCIYRVNPAPCRARRRQLVKKGLINEFYFHCNLQPMTSSPERGSAAARARSAASAPAATSCAAWATAATTASKLATFWCCCLSNSCLSSS